MKLLFLLLLVAASTLTSWAQTNWYTPEVARQLQRVSSPDEPAIAPPFRTQKFKLSHCRIEAALVAHFDTIATYAQGRVVDGRSYRPVADAIVEVVSSCFGRSIATQTAITDSAGFFCLG